MEKIGRTAEVIIAYTAALLSIVASVLGIAAFYLALTQGQPDTQLKALAYWEQICIFALILLVGYMVRTLRHDIRVMTEMRVSEAKVIEHIHGLAHETRDTIAMLNGSPLDNPTPLITALDTLQLLFDELTHQNCALCIKLFEGQGQQVWTLCRDRRSKANRGHRDKDKHDAKNNIDFHSMVDLEQRWWCSNDLQAEKNYSNTDPQWQKKYRSTIVVPIKQPVGEDERLIQGFLCVDAPRKDAFELNNHPTLLAAAADTIQPLVSSHCEYLRKKRSD